MTNGAKLVLGGQKLQRDGFFYEPTVLDHVNPEDSVFKEEIFGPVLAVTTYNDFDQVIDDAMIQMLVYLHIFSLKTLKK